MEPFDALIVVVLLWATLTLVSPPSSSKASKAALTPKPPSEEDTRQNIVAAEIALQASLPDYRDHEFMADAVQAYDDDNMRYQMLQTAKNLPLGTDQTLDVADIYDTLTSSL